MVLPKASPSLFWVRNADGSETKISAAADATDNVENVIAWFVIEGDEEDTIEYSTVVTVKNAPATRVSKVFSEELTSGDDGFGKESREVESVAPLKPVIRDEPAVGSGGGRANIEVQRAT